MNTLKASTPTESQIKGMDQKSFATLYDTYSSAIFSHLNKVLKDKELSEDALQNTFIKIWLHRDSYASEKGAPFTWMVKIAQNEAIDILRSSHYRHTKRTGALPEDAYLKHENVFAIPDLIDMHKQLFVLKPLDRNILELCFLRGFTCFEVSELLKMPLGSVKTRMQRSYNKLRAIMNPLTETAMLNAAGLSKKGPA